MTLRNVEKWNVNSSSVGNIWGVDLADMQLISKSNKRFQSLLSVIDNYSRHAWLFIKVTTITNSFQKLLHGSNRKLNKIWADNGSEFNNGSIKS